MQAGERRRGGCGCKGSRRHKMRPNDEEHSKALQPLEAEANRLTK